MLSEERFNTFEVINIIYKEFDPGSGRTLAARLTHASRTREEELALQIEWRTGE